MAERRGKSSLCVALMSASVSRRIRNRVYAERTGNPIQTARPLRATSSGRSRFEPLTRGYRRALDGFSYEAALERANEKARRRRLRAELLELGIPVR